MVRGQLPSPLLLPSLTIKNTGVTPAFNFYRGKVTVIAMVTAIVLLPKLPN